MLVSLQWILFWFEFHLTLKITAIASTTTNDQSPQHTPAPDKQSQPKPIRKYYLVKEEKADQSDEEDIDLELSKPKFTQPKKKKSSSQKEEADKTDDEDSDLEETTSLVLKF